MSEKAADHALPNGYPGTAWERLQVWERRFGPYFGKRCRNHDTMICASKRCQMADRCRWEGADSGIYDVDATFVHRMRKERD